MQSGAQRDGRPSAAAQVIDREILEEKFARNNLHRIWPVGRNSSPFAVGCKRSEMTPRLPPTSARHGSRVSRPALLRASSCVEGAWATCRGSWWLLNTREQD